MNKHKTSNFIYLFEGTILLFFYININIKLNVFCTQKILNNLMAWGTCKDSCSVKYFTVNLGFCEKI
jgi:hypothetical protein